jgi:alcohol dehydrogenase (cytochrome c)
MRAGTLALFLLMAPGVYGQVQYGEGLTPAALLKPAIDSWPTYNGDYSGRRNSPLKQITTSNVGSLTTSWIYRASNFGASGFGSVIKSTPIAVNGVLYFTMPDNVWAGRAQRPRNLALQISAE